MNGLVTICHDARKGSHIGSHWPNHPAPLLYSTINKVFIIGNNQDRHESDFLHTFIPGTSFCMSASETSRNSCEKVQTWPSRSMIRHVRSPWNWSSGS